jgi:NAD(P)-dependent dehydrogenase (short-subunit alcohol dehydrogenase family)
MLAPTRVRGRSPGAGRVPMPSMGRGRLSAGPVPGPLAELFDVGGRSVIVTGAASGLGLAIAEVMAECGAVVTLADVDAAGMERAVDRLHARGLRVRSRVVDVADPEGVRALIRGTVAELGRLDVAFVNAGISAGRGPRVPEGRIERVDLETWHRVVAVNLTGVFVTMQAAAEAMRGRGGGRIIVTASVAGLRGDPPVGYAYVATKAAVINLVRQAALDLARDGILVNAIAPGPFLTNIAGGRVRDPEVAREFAREVPLGRIADPAEIRGPALFLASPASSFVTGTVLAVDGGESAGPPV